jgi:hypothetical protein
MTIIASNREAEVRLGEKGRRVFTQAGWNRALRNAGTYAGFWWLANYGPLRWNKGYAMSQLGYRPGARKLGRMARGELPFFSTGSFQNGFNTRANVVAKAKKGGARFWVTIPGGALNFHPEHVRAFRTIPARESAAVAREFRKSLIMELQSGRKAFASKQQAKAAAKAQRAADRAAARAERRSRAKQPKG